MRNFAANPGFFLAPNHHHQHHHQAQPPAPPLPLSSAAAASAPASAQMPSAPYSYESARRRSLGSERYPGGTSLASVCQDLG